MTEKKRVSIIFTNKELEIIKQRLEGDLNDHTGVFSRRIRPKLKEIQAWLSPIMKKQMKKLLKQQRVSDAASQDAPIQKRKMGFEEFKKKHGY